MKASAARSDIVTDQASAHDLLNDYLPQDWGMAKRGAKRENDPKAVGNAARQHETPRRRDDQVLERRRVDAELPQQHALNCVGRGARDCVRLSRFCARPLRPLSCRGIDPSRWLALLGDPEDICKTDAKIKELFLENTHLHNWLDMARERISSQDLPARIRWIALGDCHCAGLALNEMVASGELKAAIVIGRDHLDAGSASSPNRETEAMKDGSDAVSDWPLKNALVNTAAGVTWVSIHHGGGVDMGFSQLRTPLQPTARCGWRASCGAIRPAASGGMQMQGMRTRWIARASMD